MKMAMRQNKSFALGASCALSLVTASCFVQSATAGIAFQTQNDDTAIYTFGSPVESGENARAKSLVVKATGEETQGNKE